VSAGLAAIERGKANGRCDTAYAAPSRATIPPDLAGALSQNLPAAEFFATLDRKNRYAILFRLPTAKKLGTGAARLGRFVAMLSKVKCSIRDDEPAPAASREQASERNQATQRTASNCHERCFGT
jgi:uncharacterized protein YdeI (YjbR/CyaY-like superfamily)